MHTRDRDHDLTHNPNLFDWEKQQSFTSLDEALPDDAFPDRPELQPEIQELLNDAYSPEEKVNVLFEAVRDKFPFKVSFSERLSDTDEARAKGFLYRYCGELQELMADAPGASPNVIFGTGHDIFQHKYAKAAVAMPESERAKLRAKADTNRGLYTIRDQTALINVANRCHVTDIDLLETLAHELTHHKDDVADLLKFRPRLAQAARAAGGLAVIGMGVAVCGNTSLGPEINGMNFSDPVIMTGVWKARAVGADAAARVEYFLRPAETRARRAANHAVAKLS